MSNNVFVLPDAGKVVVRDGAADVRVVVEVVVKATFSVKILNEFKFDPQCDAK